MNCGVADKDGTLSVTLEKTKAFADRNARLSLQVN
jgi:hypothetical protein